MAFVRKILDPGDLLHKLAPKQNTFTAGNSPESIAAGNQVQQGFGQQQDFINALAGQNGLANQAGVFAQQQQLANQLGQQAQGLGPNPAQAALNNATGQNVQNQAALMAGQRGAGANAGLLARQAAQQGGGLQQQAVGQGALMQAQQQIAAQQALAQQQAQMAGLANTQVGQQASALQGLQTGQLANQGQLLNAQGNANLINSGIAGANQKTNNSVLGGILGAAGEGISMLGGSKSGGSSGGGSSGLMAGGGDNIGSSGTMYGYKGGQVPGYDNGGMIPQQPMMFGQPPIMMGQTPVVGPQSSIGQYLNSMTNEVQPMQMPEEKKEGGGLGKFIKTAATIASFLDEGGEATQGKLAYVGASKDQQKDNAQKAQNGFMKAANDNPISKAINWMQSKPMKEGGGVPGQAKVNGDSLKNDTVPAMLSPGEVVIPRHVMQSKDPPKAAAEFVRQVMARKKKK